MTEWITPAELPDLRHVDKIALDSETKDDRLRVDMGSGWPFHAGYISGLSVAFRAEGGMRGLYFPFRHPDSQNFDPEQVYQWLRDHIASNVRFVTQNGLYDFGWLRTEAGIKMPPSKRLEEIGALATVVDENRFKYSLDALCAWRGLPGKDEALLYEGIAALGLVENKRKKVVPQNYLWQLPARYVGPYAEADAIKTLALFESLYPVLDQEGTRDAYRLECDLLPMVHEMRRRGVRVDVDAAERARDHLLRKRDAVFAELSEKLGANVGMAEIGRCKWLAQTFDQHGITYPRTEKGNPSFAAGNSGWMTRHPHWLPQLIVKADRFNNAAVNFIQHYILDHVVQGRIHAEIHPHRSDEGGTRSLRFSYSDPPLQLMPAHDEELTALIRGVFLPEAGEVWASADVSQQEFRFIVHYAARHKLAGAQQAVERYRDDPNTDFHIFVAEMTELARASAKGANFAKAFGAGVRRFATMINKSEHEARTIMDTYDQRLPFVHLLSESCQRVATRRGYLTLYDGARRHWSDFEMLGVAWTKGAGPCALDEAERRVKDPNHPWYGRRTLRRADTRKAMNALIQGSAARHTKLWMRACWREGILPLLQMHDALECSVTSREQTEHIAQLGCEAVKLEVPMRIDVKYGRSWGDARHSWAESMNGTPFAALPSSTITVAAPIVQPELAAVHADVDVIELCVYCQAPLGPGRVDAHNGGFLHPQCQDPFSRQRFAEEGIDWESTVPAACETLTHEPRPNGKDDIGSNQTAWAEIARNAARQAGKGNGRDASAATGDNVDAGYDLADSQGRIDPNLGHEHAAPDPVHRPDLAGVPLAGGVSATNGDRAHSPSPGSGGADAQSTTTTLAGGSQYTPSNNYREPPENAPYAKTRARLLRHGYHVVQTFDYVLPGGRVLYHEDRYELPSRLAPSQNRPRKTYRLWHLDGAQALDNTGPAEQRIVYNWPAILEAGPGAQVHVTEGARKADALITKGLLATAVAYHSWNDRCIDTLRGLHLVYHEDHDPPNEHGIRPGEKYAADARAKLAPVAASFRILPARKLWENLGRTGDPTPGFDIKDWLDAGGDATTLLKICGQVPAEATETIEPIDLWGQFDPPPLPAGLLPEVIEQFAREEGEIMGADPSGLAMSALVVCAAALPDYVQIQVKRHDPNWLESARLWVGLIGPPSTKKTPEMLRATKPLKQIDAKLWRAYVSEQECYDELSKEERKTVERPRQERLRLEDTTIEAAQEVLKDSPNGVLCIQDELSGWFGAMDKYSGRGAAKDRAFWLQSYHGGSYPVNRISRGSFMIENLSACLLGGIQPDPIRKIAADTIDDGLLQRLLPIILVPGTVGKDVPGTLAGQRYDDLVAQLHEYPRPTAPLQFDDAALAIRAELEQKHLALMACEIVNKKLAAHIGKYDGIFARLCLLWHCIEGAEGAFVTEHTARRVADFMHRFLLPHAAAFYTSMLELSDDHERLTKVAGYILANKLAQVTNRDVQRGSRAMRGLKRQDVDGVFDQLEALGWVTRIPGRRWTDPPRWQVNPEVHRRFTERAVREAAERAKQRETLLELQRMGHG